MREVQRSLARTTREYMLFLFVVIRLWKRNSFFVIVYLLLVFLATVQRLHISLNSGSVYTPAVYYVKNMSVMVVLSKTETFAGSTAT